MIRREMLNVTTGLDDDANDVLALTAEMAAEAEARTLPAPSTDRGKKKAAPPTLAYATAAPVKPWRGFAIAAGLHVLVAGGVIAFVKVHLPRPPPDSTMISVVEETTPQGNSNVNSMHVHPAPSPPVPPHPMVPPKPPIPMSQPRPPVPVVAKAELKLSAPPKPVTVSTPRLLKPIIQPPALVEGTHIPATKTGVQVVAATRPALADSENTAPVYTIQERDLGEQGVVTLNIVVLPDGRVFNATIAKSSGFSTLDYAAREAAMNWHFQPALRDGMPVASTIPYSITFELQ